MIQTPFTMNKSIMGKVAQLADFDEQLYKVRARMPVCKSARVQECAVAPHAD